MALQLVWFRTDLRIHDNSALAAAAQKGPVVAIFMHCHDQWQAHGHGANKRDFWVRGVDALKDALAGLNIPLLQCNASTFDQVPQQLVKLANEVGADSLHFNCEYPLNEQRRDDTVSAHCQAAGLGVYSYHDAVAFAPDTLLTGKGDYYGVFTPFSKAWHKNIQPEQLALRNTPAPQAPLSIQSDDTLIEPELSVQAGVTQGWPAGEQAAQDRLERFLRFRSRYYQSQRDFPDVRGTSELSAYLALGMISWRQCMHAVLSENGSLNDGDPGLVAWVSELIWREFYQHVAVGFPQVCQHQPFQAHTSRLAWRDDDAAFAAWCEGRTGYPIVDAAMRQLVNTGWMHNRLRMITAMFLSKHLLMDWRRGEAFFLKHLIDGEFCANNGGWQWAASTGTDAAPYFRIFNPTTQSSRFDPKGNFIAHWLPELEPLPAKARHAPPRDLLTQLEYPAPIVEHKMARQRALDAFKALKE